VVLKSAKVKHLVDTFSVKPQLEVPENFVVTTGRNAFIDLSDSYNPDEGSMKAIRYLIEAPDDSTHTLQVNDCFTTDDADGDSVTYILEHADFGGAADPDKPATLVAADMAVVWNNDTYIVHTVGSGTISLSKIDTDLIPLDWIKNLSENWPYADELPLYTSGITIHVYKQTFTTQTLQGSYGFYSGPTPSDRFSFEADVAGTYVVLCLAYDMEHFSRINQVVLEARDSTTVLGESINADYIWKYLSTAWSEFSETEYFTEYFSGLTQLAGNQLTQLWQNEKNESLQDIQPFYLYRWMDIDNRVTETKPSTQTWTSGLVPITHLMSSGAHTGKTAVLDIFSGAPDDREQVTVTVSTATDEVDAIEDLVSQLNDLGYEFTVTTELRGSDYWFTMIAPYFFTFSGGTGSGTLFPSPGGPEDRNLTVCEGKVISKRMVLLKRSLHDFTPDGHSIIVEGVAYKILRVIDDLVGSSWDNIVVVDSDIPYQHIMSSSVVYGYRYVSIPGYFTSEEVDWEENLVFNADVVYLTLGKDGAASNTSSWYVVGAQDNKVYVSPDIFGTLPDDYEPDNPYWDAISLDYVARKTYKLVDDTVRQIPRIQQNITLPASPTNPTDYFKEGTEHCITSFRGSNAVHYGWYSLPAFAGDFLVDNVLLANASIAEQMWAEHVLVDQKEHISNSFGSMVDFEADDFDTFKEKEYLSAVRGLWFVFGRGRTLEDLSVGLNIFCSLPVNDVAGTIVSIKNNDALDNFRIVIQDASGNNKIYLVSRDLGLGTNPATGVVWAVGDSVPRFSILSNGVETSDWESDPKWFLKKRATSGTLWDYKFWETQKYHTFKAGIPAKDYSSAFIEQIYNFLLAYRPMHTFLGDKGFYAWRQYTDDIPVEEEMTFSVTVHMMDGLCGTGALVYDSGYLAYGGGGMYDMGAFDVCPDEEVEVDKNYTFTGSPMYDTILSYDGYRSPPLPAVTYDGTISGAYTVTIVIHS
jgi:hypothetical protein